MAIDTAFIFMKILVERKAGSWKRVSEARSAGEKIITA